MFIYRSLSINQKMNSTRGVPLTRAVVHYYHLGVWGFAPTEDCDAWSCCLNDVKDSQGCTKRAITKPQNWNVVSQ